MAVTRTQFVSAVSTVALALAERWNIGTVDGEVTPAPTPAPVPTPSPTPVPTPTPTPTPVPEEPEQDEEFPVPEQEGPPVLDPSIVRSGSLSDIPGFAEPQNGIAAQGGASKVEAQYPNDGHIADIAKFGSKLVRLPVKEKWIMERGGEAFNWHVNQIVSKIKVARRYGMKTAVDFHDYQPMDTAKIGPFVARVAAAVEKALGGPADDVLFEIQNEPSTKPAGSWDRYGRGLKNAITHIRNAGVKGTLVVNWGFYSKYASLGRAIDSINKVGGLAELDPLNRLVWAAHDYWEPTGNDLAGKIQGNIKIAERYAPMLKLARDNGIVLVMGEIGLGGGTNGWLPSDRADGKDGKAVFAEYVEWARANADVLKGTWAWSAGRTGTGYNYHIGSPTNPHGAALAQFFKGEPIT